MQLLREVDPSCSYSAPQEYVPRYLQLEFPAHIWTAALLGLVCSVAFMRYFTPALAVLSLASYFDAWVQSIPIGSTGRASVSRIASLVFTTVLLLGWIGFVGGGCLLVGV